jgi:hypothetical protein
MAGALELEYCRKCRQLLIAHKFPPIYAYCGCPGKPDPPLTTFGVLSSEGLRPDYFALLRYSKRPLRRPKEIFFDDFSRNWFYA